MDTFKRVNIVFSCVIVSVTITFIIVAWTLPDSMETVSNTMCLNVDGTLGCQHSLSEVLNRHLKNYLEDLKHNEKETEIRNDGSEDIPAARFAGCDSLGHLNLNSSIPHTITAWWKEDGFDRNGARFHNGRIIVPLGGHYFVYSFVDFHEVFGPNGESSENLDCDIDHGIYKYNIIEGEEKRLISSLQPHQVPYGRTFNIYSSFVCLLVELRAGDEVSVKVNHPRFIRDTKYNVFGLTMI